MKKSFALCEPTDHYDMLNVLSKHLASILPNATAEQLIKEIKEFIASDFDDDGFDKLLDRLEDQINKEICEQGQHFEVHGYCSYDGEVFQPLFFTDITNE